MLGVFLDSIAKPAELAALYQYKFAPKSASAQRLQQTLAKDASKKRCYDFLNMVNNYALV
jgi:farnesyl-diphosphate farnesyltransferase